MRILWKQRAFAVAAALALPLVGGVATALAAGAAATPAPPGPAATPTAGPAAPTVAPAPAAGAPATTTAPAAVAPPTAGPGEIVLRSDALAVTVSDAFPQVVRYTHLGTGATLDGRAEPLTAVVIDGTAHPVEVTAHEPTASAASYTLTFPGLPGVEIDARLSVAEAVAAFEVTAIRDTEAHRVHTLDIPGHDLVSVASDQPGATVAAARVGTDRGGSGDTITPVTAQTAAGPAQGSAYVIVSTDALAAGLETNSVYDEANGPAQKDNNRWQRQARADGEDVRMGVWSGRWTYRSTAAAVEDVEPLPVARVAITPDANGDGTVNWQDGAIAYRDIAVAVPGEDEVPDTVVTHIPFNFASQATHPFLRTLDDVKRISLATDGLGQRALLKGYGAEGHDSAHPDYGGNYNERAGGLEDLNTLLAAGERWNASFGVHVNATEVYPEAKTFGEVPFDPKAPGWNWLNQSYYLDQREDLGTHNITRRFAQLREETHENLDFLYLDVYYNYGWQADRLARELGEQGWTIGTEWSDRFERYSLWSHWANDENYGGSTNKGLNSQIIRFIDNAHKDTWNPHPLLGYAQIVEFEGWTGHTDYTAFLRNVWSNNLPVKFLQHQDIVRWADGQIDFTGDVTATGTDAASRQFTVGDDVVLDGDAYLLPWSADDGSKRGRDTQKLYHYNADGGRTTWTLTDDFAKQKKLRLFRLTDTGRVPAGMVDVVDGTVTLTAEPDQAYVLYPHRSNPQPAKPDWGEGTLVVDPGFNAGNLDAYRPRGDVSLETNERGQHVAVLGAGPSSIRQELGKAAPGTYAASAWIEIAPGQERPTTLRIQGRGIDESVTVDASTARNYVAADEKNDTYFQRVRVVYDIPARSNGKVTLSVSAGDGEAPVRVDDLRVVPFTRAADPDPVDGTILFEDFESVDQGWWPFVKGDAGGITDPRTHLASRNAPYTQAGWNGKLIDDVLDGQWSLKSHQENTGLVYRTAPQSVAFQPGHRYRVSFDYQAAHAGYYEWVTGYDTVATGEPRSVRVNATPIGQQRTTAAFSEEFVAGGCGDYWVGLNKLTGNPKDNDLVVDNLRVVDLGPAESVPACASLGVEPAQDALEQGFPNAVTTTLVSDEAADVTDVAVTLDVPEGWTAEPASASTAASLAPGASLRTTWTVTPPADAPQQDYPLTATATYQSADGPRTASATTTVRVLPPPPTGDAYVSDLELVSAENGWGPVERDRSNGEQAAGDGRPITLNGQVYAKGLGTHAPSRVRVYLAETCTTFTADVGIDDVQKSRGSVVFKVLGDGATLAESPVMRPDSATHRLEADVTGTRYLDLVVTDAGDGNGNDHGDWADARLSCSAAAPQG
ncbi:endo-alpha-N-acetylgalactosaminidase family protein [Georgenia sp. TF02-10]|uniref:endo-alpha-N-acetylgalactosaminidase family protein n=1 Tax=Georgenia sp. TF02-10 TaxID=2917725 RepID=UPI001FA6E19B|nr:endo-alpha-N-acetylgalactosaminidase family protein [Georgenia sp. TF02-10]UNX55182.1 endo-alpha-N-acetylgalactosaminidase family protein [Georgenia sp. TF02-10]